MHINMYSMWEYVHMYLHLRLRAVHHKLLPQPQKWYPSLPPPQGGGLASVEPSEFL